MASPLTAESSSSGPDGRRRKGRSVFKCDSCRKKKIYCPDYGEDGKCPPCQRKGYLCGPRVLCPPGASISHTISTPMTISSQEQTLSTTRLFATPNPGSLRLPSVLTSPEEASNADLPLPWPTTPTGSIRRTISSTPQTSLFDSFKELGFLLGLMNEHQFCARQYHLALPNFTHPGQPSHRIKWHVLQTAHAHVERRFAKTLHEVFTRILDDSSDLELWLRRLSDLLRDYEFFIQALETNPELNSVASEQVANIHLQVLQKLVDSCYNIGLFEDARRFHQTICSKTKDSLSFQGQSWQIFEGVSEGRGRIYPYVHLSDHGLAPSSPSHLMMGSGIAEMSPILDNYKPSRDLSGMTIVHKAIDTGNVHLVAKLLDKQPKGQEARDSFQRTLLLHAAHKGDLASVEILTKRNADRSALDRWNRTAPVAACDAGHIDVVKFFLCQGWDPNEQLHLQCCTALCAAAGAGHVPIVRLLLENDADPSETSNRNQATAMDYARKNHRNEVIRLLVEDAKTRANTQEQNGSSSRPQLSTLTSPQDRLRQNSYQDPGAKSLQPMSTELDHSNSLPLPTPVGFMQHYSANLSGSNTVSHNGQFFTQGLLHGDSLHQYMSSTPATMDSNDSDLEFTLNPPGRF